MGTLTLTTLGRLEIRHAGVVLTFRTRKTLALLVYLARGRGSALAREADHPALAGERCPRMVGRCCAAPWPSCESAMGEDAAPPAHAHLIVERTELGFNRRADFRLDLDQLTVASRAGWDELQAAVGAYQGDFLADFILGDAPEFDDWAARRREAAHVRHHGIARPAVAVTDRGRGRRRGARAASGAGWPWTRSTRRRLPG